MNKIINKQDLIDAGWKEYCDNKQVFYECDELKMLGDIIDAQRVRIQLLFRIDEILSKHDEITNNDIDQLLDNFNENE